MRAAIVTGAGTGIGEACARRLAADGYAVTLFGRRRELLERVAQTLDAPSLVVAGDVGEEVDVQRVIGSTLEAFGQLDALVLNAGVGDSGAAGDESLENWERTLRINLTGAFLTAHAALPALIKQRGALVGVASVNAVRAGPGWASYCASKAGLVMLLQTIARDYGPRGVRANAVLPGWVRTPMGDEDMAGLAAKHKMTSEDAYAMTHSHVPIRRPAEPHEIASVVAFLLSEEASYVNGAALPIDGGASIVDVSSVAWD